MTRFRRGLPYLFGILLFYAVAEAGYSMLYRHGKIFPPRRVVLYEESERSYVFDPVLGHRITQVPTRSAIYTDGWLEMQSDIVGNAQGFSDRKDFTVNRAPGETLRFAVFGDSFSVLQSLDRTWPEVVEDEFPGTRLLNVSISGAGLANWWSVMQKEIAANNYQLDGIVFAAFESTDPTNPGDLDRNFTILDHSTGKIMGGRAGSWDPATWPRTLDEARPWLRVTERRIVRKDAFERTLAGKIAPGLPLPFDFYLTRALLQGRISPDLTVRPKYPPYSSALLPGQQRLVEDIAATCRARRWPVLVVRIPGREEAIARTPVSEKLQTFSRLLDGKLIDGAAAFASLTADEVRADWYPVDGHWNQSGSDRFARWMQDELRTWVAETAPAQ